MEILEFEGSELIDLEYKPMFDYFKNHKNAFKVKHADFVSDVDGTGIVHVAPAFGEDDYNLCNQYDVKIVCPIDDGAIFNEEVPDLQGMQVFEANDFIIKKLKQQSSLLKIEQYFHNYPHCWRTDTPLIYKAISSWYLNVEKIKDRMIDLNKEINWIPNHIKEGQFGKWIENAKDWCIARNRFWGCPIPIWMSNNPKNKKIYVFGSIEEIENFFEQKVENLHRPYIDKLTKQDPFDSKYLIKRVEDVLDCWFESGSMPFASLHYPFENKEFFEKNFPADFIVEYLAQTRGWFYTLLVISTGLFDKIPFKNSVCHGVILDENGEKLSKRLKNYPDPKEVFEKYGADAMRWALLRTSVLNGEELKIDKKGLMFANATKLFLQPLYNACQFFKAYLQIDKLGKSNVEIKSDNIMDIYILSKFRIFFDQAKENFDSYNIQMICLDAENFIDTLNNWYIRRNKQRFWKNEKDADKQYAYETLYFILKNFSIIISPIAPFLTEYIYEQISEFED